MPSTSPYQSPQSTLNQNISISDSNVVIKRLPAMRGIHWFFDGFRRVFKSPFRWSAIGFINFLMLVVFAIFSLIPLLGTFIPYLFYPVIVAGFMYAAFKQDSNELSVTQLFAGFSQQTGQLFLSGALYLAMMVGVFIVVFGLMFVVGFTLFSGGNTSDFGSAMLMALLAGLLFLGLMLPAIMAIWFVPALIILLKVDAIESIKLSFKGCLRNFLPYLLYSLVALVLLMIFVALIVGLFTSFNLQGTQPQNYPMALWFIIGGLYFLMAVYGAPIVFCSIYSSFDDIYHLQQDAIDNEAVNERGVATESAKTETDSSGGVSSEVVNPETDNQETANTKSHQSESSQNDNDNDNNDDSPIERK